MIKNLAYYNIDDIMDVLDANDRKQQKTKIINKKEWKN